jgi:peptidoglycan/LPS O-acetylase OafA/YrhL
MKPAASAPARDYLPVIDLLRFFAATFIMLYHFGYRSWRVNGESALAFPELLEWQVLQYAFLLVPLFLLISGFVIPISAEGRTAGAFARSRFLRLYPAFWLCCTITWIVTSLWGPTAVQSGPAVYAANMTMLHGFLHVKNLDSVYWTLTVELRFYTFIFLVLLVRRFHQLTWFVAGWLLISLIDQFHYLPRGDSLFVTTYAPLFSAGILFGQWYRGTLTRLGAVLLPAALIMGTARMMIYAADDAQATGMQTSPVAVAGVMMVFYVVFAAIASHRLRMQRAAAWAPMMGGISYPLFVLHNFAGITLMSLLAPYLNRWLILTSVMALSYLAAWFIWRYFEKAAVNMLKRCLP